MEFTDEYQSQADGSGIVTRTFMDGSVKVFRLPPPFVVEAGTLRTTAEDWAAAAAMEYRISESDRRERPRRGP